jgi:PAS domain S-box-containing protein
MISAPLPANEIERLMALRIYEVLDTAPEAEFDDLTRLASYICGTPIALVTLVDASRQWFKSRVGIEVSETPRETAFCAHAILGDELFEVPNALEDQRFADNPLVTGSPDIRFYAGVPLRTVDGFNLGTVCVIDRVPRKLDENQRDALRTISHQVVRLLEMRAGAMRLDREAAFRQAILDSAVPSIISTTPLGIITTFSRGAEKMLGYRADEIVGKTTPVPIHDIAEVSARAQELTAELGRPIAPGFEVFVARVGDGKSETRVWTYVRKDGTRLPVRLSVSEIVNKDGALIGFLGIARDITEEKRNQEKLERLAAELRRSNEDLEQFATVASHDLQEPLRMVANFLTLLDRRYHGRLDAEADKFIAFAVNGATRMQALIQDLLSYSKIGTTEKRRVPVHISIPIDFAMENLKLLIAEKQADISVAEMPTLPADSALIMQVFQNLIGNALKFSGKDAPRIRITARRDGSEWIFSVADNGIGIEARDRDRIFVIFQRLHSREEYAGTGIGLAICKRIVELHGGRIWAESEPGKGSVFHFSLPAAEAKD